MKCFADFDGKGRAGITTIVVLVCLLALSPATANAAQPGLVVTPLDDDFGGGTASGYDSSPMAPDRAQPGQTDPGQPPPAGTSVNPGGDGPLPPQMGQSSYKDGMVMAYLVDLMRKQNMPCPSGSTPPAPPSLIFSEPLCRVAEAVGNGSEFPAAYEAQGIYASHWRMFSAPNQPAQQVATRLRAEHCETLLEPHTHIGAWLGPQGWRIVLATLTNKPEPDLVINPSAPAGDGAAPAPSSQISTPATAPAAVAGLLATPAPPGASVSSQTPAQTPAVPVPAAAPAVADSGDKAVGQEARAMFLLINELRAKGGSCLGKPMKAAAPLTFDSTLQAAAEKGAADAAAKEGFGAASGSSRGEIKGTESYPGAKVAKLYGISAPPASTMADVWRLSPQFCEVLLSPEYDDIGVAYDGRYWVVLMGQKSKGVPSPEIPASRQKQTSMP